MQYFVMTDERRMGPFTEEQLRERIQAGDVHAQTPIWHEGLDKWKPCGNLFGDMPEIDSWYAMMDGRREGPMTPRVFQNEVNAGRIAATTVVWRTGMPRWRRLGKVALEQDVELADAKAPAQATPGPGIPMQRPSHPGTSAQMTPAPSFSQFSVPTPSPSAGVPTPHPGSRRAPAEPPPVPPAGTESGMNAGMNPLFAMDFDLPHPPAKPVQKPPRGVALARFDGVSPPFDYGGFWIRLLAIFIDGALTGMVVAVAVTALGVTLMGPVGAMPPMGANVPPAQVQAAAAAALSGMIRRMFFLQLLISLYPILTTWWLGGTFGKLVCGLRVVRSDGEALSFLRCAARELLKMFVSGPILCIGFLLAAFTEEKKTLHDMICDTRVVKNG